jgi:hypothetical protein
MWVMRVNFDWLNLFNPVLALLPAGIVYFIAQNIFNNLYISASLLSVIYLVLAWKAMFGKEERKFLISVLPEGIKNIVEKNQLFFD